jgi:transcriptional regulator with XRE-family HTH domain
MSKDGPQVFGDYLARVIRDAGFTKPTHFARKAGIDPSLVFRWISGEQRPTLASLERIAPVLGVPQDTLVQAAYPGETGPPPEPPRDPGEELILSSDATPTQKKIMLERYRRKLETGRRQALEDVREQIHLLRSERAG